MGLLQNDLKLRLKQKHGKWYYIFLAFILFFSVYLVFKTFFYAFDIQSKSAVSFVLDSYANLKEDKNGFVNVLLIGHGGGNHDGADLTDTMILSSIDLKNRSVVMLSVPRDLFVCYEYPRYPCSRINEIYRDMELRFKAIGINEQVAKEQARWQLIKAISDITNMEIAYYSQIDFRGFERVVDMVGGITIDAPETIIDYTYPDGNWGFETFKLEKGIHKLDGKTALKYARSRHSTSDFDRSARQQAVLDAIKNEVLGSYFFINPLKLKEFIGIASENFITNFRTSQMLSLAFHAKDFSKENMYNTGLHDDWEKRGGFLGTPPRAAYGGAYVLIPYSGEGDYSKIKVFTDIIFNNRDLTKSKIEVLNATEYGGTALKAAKRFERYGMTIASIGNARELLDECELRIYTNNINGEKLKEYWGTIFPGVKLNLVNKKGYYDETDTDAEFLIGKNIEF